MHLLYRTTNHPLHLQTKLVDLQEYTISGVEHIGRMIRQMWFPWRNYRCINLNLWGLEKIFNKLAGIGNRTGNFQNVQGSRYL